MVEKASMKNAARRPELRIFAACTALLTLITGSCLAESGNYRIEVLVFSHLDSTAEPLLVDEIRSFEEFPELGEPQVPAAPVQLKVMSNMMQDVSRRLRLSASYHPIMFASWEQTRIDYHPPVRLHDEELIAEQLSFPHGVAFIDLRKTDLFEDYLAPYYQLDGTVQLQRTRFLHLNLDLEFRHSLLARGTATTNSDTAGITGIIVDMADINISQDGEIIESERIEDFLGPSPGPALVHALKQTRQIRTGQMQYFDTPYLGVLVRVTATMGL